MPGDLFPTVRTEESEGRALGTASEKTQALTNPQRAFEVYLF